MKACVATGEKGKIELRDVPEPELEAGSLLLKTHCSLICGSDIEYLQGLHGDIIANEIRGHEFVAEVAAVGKGVSDWKVGDRAVPISHTSNYGCWADYFVCPPIGVQKVPDNVSDEDAVFVEPLHTGFGSAEACNIKPSEAVCVIGAATAQSWNRHDICQRRARYSVKCYRDTCDGDTCYNTVCYSIVCYKIVCYRNS